jgi:hypothetical protein
MSAIIGGHEVPRRIRNTADRGATAYQVLHAGKWRRVRYVLDLAGLFRAEHYVNVNGNTVSVFFDPPL